LYDTMSSKRSSQEYTMGRDKRFQEASNIVNLKRHVPHSYLKTTANLSLTDWKGSKLSKGKRFTKDNPFYKETIGPGPQYNLQDKPSMINSSSRLSLETEAHDSRLFGAPYSKYKNVYFHELGRDFCNREGPGPAQYDSNKAAKGQKYSFPKNSRKLSTITKKDKTPSPTSYRYEKQSKLLKNIGTVFSKGSREVDFSKYASQNSVMIEKGLY